MEIYRLAIVASRQITDAVADWQRVKVNGAELAIYSYMDGYATPSHYLSDTQRCRDSSFCRFEKVKNSTTFQLL